jgi:hypothetical protein
MFGQTFHYTTHAQKAGLLDWNWCVKHIMFQYEATLILGVQCKRQQTNDRVSQTDVFNGIR